jgi:hypothetical protein
MTVETRYFVKPNALKTSITEPYNPGTVEDWKNGAGYTCYYGFRVYKLSASNVETEITSGWVTGSTRSTSGSGFQSWTWNCPQTSLDPTDKIRVYLSAKVDATGGVAVQFTTEALGVTQLDAATWTFYMYTERSYDAGTTFADIYYGSIVLGYDSRIENFSYSTPAVGIASKRLLRGVGL